MARSILINGLNLPIRLADFDFAEAARNGEVATGGFELDSENAATDINSHWPIRVRDTAASSNDVFNGYIADKTITRGPFAIDRDRQFDVNTVDLNTLLIDDIITGASGNRPEETDIARVTWLVGTSFLSGMGATIGSGGSTTLETADFRTQTPLDLLTQAAETAGKLFFVYWDFATEAPKLFYDLATASNFITSSKISTYLADGSNPTTHHPRKESLVRNLDGGRIYSELLFKYDGGSVTVTNTATASNYRNRKTVIYDNFVKSSAQATRKANQYLNTVSTPEDVITLDVDLTAAQVNEFRAGQLMQIKAPHLGLPTFVDRRIVRTSKKPRVGGSSPDSEDYTVTMELSVPKSNRFGSSGVPTDQLPVTPDVPTAEPATVETVTGACVSLSLYHLDRTMPPDHTVVQTVEGPSFGGSSWGSWVYYNQAWSVTGCPIGGGAWVGYNDREAWWVFTAPADDASYLGLYVTIDTTAVWTTGFVGGYQVGIVNDGPDPGDYGTATGGLGGATVGGITTVYVPRSLIAWGAENSIVFSPTWLCARDFFTCNSSGYFGNPKDDGRGGSGAYHGARVTAACPVRFATGTTGLSGEVAAYGAVDGVNRTFTLIGWDGTGTPEHSVNGLEQPSVGVAFNRTTGTATMEQAPETGSIVLWSYTVGAIAAEVTLTPDPVAVILLVPEPRIPQPIYLLPDPAAVMIVAPEPTVTI